MSDNGVVEFGEMEEALQSHLALLSADLADEVSFLSCQLKSERSFVELNFGFTLRRDQMLRQHVVKMGSLPSATQPLATAWPKGARQTATCGPSAQEARIYRYGVRSSAPMTRVKGIWASSFTCFTSSAEFASNRHIVRPSSGTKVVRM